MSDLATAARPRGIVGLASGLAERRLGRRGLLARLSLVGAAVATNGFDFILRPGSAYASVCGTGTGCNSGWTAMCCTINKGVNQCPPGTFAGGWWKASGASLCGGNARYIVDCQAKCTKCGCGGRAFCKKGCANCKSRCAKGSCDKRKTCHNMFRYGQCSRDIKCSGPISCRAISCTPPWKWADCTKTSATDNYTRGHSASCLPVWSSIMKRYTAMGSQNSVLGATIGVEFNAPLPGRVQRYENGRMYYSKRTGAHWLDGRLLARYRQDGQKSLGFPTSDAVELKGGRGVRMEKGGIYQADGKNAYTVFGAIFEYWRSTGAYGGPLGYPLGSYTVSGDKQGNYQLFVKGIVTNGKRTPTCGVWGAAAKKYRALDYAGGGLGWTKRDERTVLDVDGVSGLETLFEKGTIMVVGNTAAGVWGPIHEHWRANGGPAGPLGHPVSDVVRFDGQYDRCDFRNGALLLDRATGQIQAVPNGNPLRPFTRP